MALFTTNEVTPMLIREYVELEPCLEPRHASTETKKENETKQAPQKDYDDRATCMFPSSCCGIADYLPPESCKEKTTVTSPEKFFARVSLASTFSTQTPPKMPLAEAFVKHLKELLSLESERKNVVIQKDVVILSRSHSTDEIKQLLSEKSFDAEKFKIYGKENFQDRSANPVLKDRPAPYASFIEAIKDHEKTAERANHAMLYLKDNEEDNQIKAILKAGKVHNLNGQHNLLGAQETTLNGIKRREKMVVANNAPVVATPSVLQSTSEHTDAPKEENSASSKNALTLS